MVPAAKYGFSSGSRLGPFLGHLDLQHGVRLHATPSVSFRLLRNIADSLCEVCDATRTLVREALSKGTEQRMHMHHNRNCDRGSLRPIDSLRSDPLGSALW